MMPLKIQPLEHPCYGFVVRLLRGGETGAADAVVDGLVNGVDGLIDVVAQVFGQEAGFGGGECFELGVDHANDLARLVVDDRPDLPVPQHGRGDAPV